MTRRDNTLPGSSDAEMLYQAKKETIIIDKTIERLF